MGVVVLVVLVPIVLMAAACLLERLEALALPSRRRARAVRSLPAATRRPSHLAAVPDRAPIAAPADTARPAPADGPLRVVGLDADTLDLRRAS